MKSEDQPMTQSESAISLVWGSRFFLATIHYEIQHKKKLLHGKGAQKKP